METTSLKFDSKDLLLAFYPNLECMSGTIDLKEFVLSSTFSQTDVLIAVKKYGARVLAEENIY